MMRRLVLLSGALALSVYGSTPASALASSLAVGECGFVDLGPQALVYTSVALVARHPQDNPVSADVGCQVYHDGSLTGEAYFSGTGVVTGARLVPYVSLPNAYVCTIVDFTSDATPTKSDCAPLADRVSCPVLASLSPLLPPGAVAITPEGDVYVAGAMVWNCPPYA